MAEAGKSGASQLPCTRSCSECSRKYIAAGAIVLTRMRRASSRGARRGDPRHGIAAIAAAKAANTSGFISPIWATMNSTTKNGSKPCGGARPSCLMNVAQPCAAFQATKGAKSAIAITRAAAEAGETSQRLSDGAARKASATPAGKKAAVNFDCSASPSATPIARSHRAFPVRQSSTSAARPERPEDHERRIRRNEHGARKHQRHRDPHQDGERGRLDRTEKTPRNACDESGQRADKNERQRPDAEFRIAEDRRRGTNYQRDHRRMVEIAESQASRPECIIGLVEGEFESLRGQRLQGEKRDRRPRSPRPRDGPRVFPPEPRESATRNRPSSRRLSLYPPSSRRIPVARRRARVNRRPFRQIFCDAIHRLN